MSLHDKMQERTDTAARLTRANRFDEAKGIIETVAKIAEGIREERANGRCKGRECNKCEARDTWNGCPMRYVLPTNAQLDELLKEEK